MWFLHVWGTPNSGTVDTLAEAHAAAQAITQINARVIATNIPGASAISRGRSRMRCHYFSAFLKYFKSGGG